MIRYKMWILIVFVCTLFFDPLTGVLETIAQNHDQKQLELPQPLTLEQCIQIALEDSTEMRNAGIDSAIQELRIKNARSLYYPDLFINGRYVVSDRSNLIFNERLLAADQADSGFMRHNYDAGITARYTLWDHGQRKANFARANESLNVTKQRNNRIKRNLVFDVTQAYYNVLKTHALIDVDQEILARSRENRERVKDFVQAGVQIEADVATAQVREANDELNLLNDQNELEIAMANLPRIMGLDPGTLITVAEDITYQLYREKGKVESIQISLEEAVQRAIENRPEFGESEARIKQLESDWTLAKLERWPRLNAESSYELSVNDSLDEPKNFREFQNWNITAMLSFPIFDGGVARRRAEEAKLALEQEHETAEDLERSIALEVRQAYLSLRRAERAFEITNTQVRNAELSLEVTRGRFEQELAILLELLDAQTEFAGALTNQVRAFYDYKIAQAALHRAMGILQ